MQYIPETLGTSFFFNNIQQIFSKYFYVPYTVLGMWIKRTNNICNLSLWNLMGKDNVKQITTQIIY